MDTTRLGLWLVFFTVAFSVCIGQSPDEDPDAERQRRPCNENWSSWEAWSDCNSGCGQVGTRIRVRQCEPPERPPRCRRQNVANCTGSYYEARICNGICGQQLSSTPPRVYPSTTQTPSFPSFPPFFPTQRPREEEDCAQGLRRGGWGDWDCWSPCSGGIRVRYRQCNKPTPIGVNNYCSGTNIQRESCRDDTSTFCTNGQDMIFAVDASGSVGSSRFNQMSNTLLSHIRTFNLDYNGNSDTRRVRVGIMTFATTAIPVKHLNDFQVPPILTYTAGGTNTDLAIDLARTQMFQSYRGDRRQNPNVLVVLTNGRSNNRIRTLTAASRAKSDGIRIIAMGIGTNTDQSELRAIASNSNLVYNVERFDELRDKLNRVFRC